MGAKSTIEWTDSSWNPTHGCSMAKGSEAKGCLNCYAARLNARNLPEMKSPTTGEPFARILESGPRWTGKVELIEKALPLPLRWKKARRIFVNSLSDLFHEALTDEQIDRVFAVMALCPQHTFQVLTKRPDRMLAYMSGDARAHIVRDEIYRWHAAQKEPGYRLSNSLAEHPLTVAYELSDRLTSPRWPLPNVWLGVSVEDQVTADARIPILLQTPAAKRFISYEPALGPVDFIPFLRKPGLRGWPDELSSDGTIDWIIVGGESGPGARPFDLGWVRNTVKQCKAAGVAVFVKQLGANPFYFTPQHEHVFMDLKSRKGGDPEEWPEDMRVRQIPEVTHAG